MTKTEQLAALSRDIVTNERARNHYRTVGNRAGVLTCDGRNEGYRQAVAALEDFSEAVMDVYALTLKYGV